MRIKLFVQVYGLELAPDYSGTRLLKLTLFDVCVPLNACVSQYNGCYSGDLFA